MKTIAFLLWYVLIASFIIDKYWCENIRDLERYFYLKKI